MCLCQSVYICFYVKYITYISNLFSKVFIFFSVLYFFFQKFENKDFLCLTDPLVLNTYVRVFLFFIQVYLNCKFIEEDMLNRMWDRILKNKKYQIMKKKTQNIRQITLFLCSKPCNYLHISFNIKPKSLPQPV